MVIIFLYFNISLIKHSAQENDNAFFGLFFPLVALIIWFAFGNPLKKWNDDNDNPIYKFRYFSSFFLLCLLTIYGVFKGIYFFWCD